MDFINSINIAAIAPLLQADILLMLFGATSLGLLIGAIPGLTVVLALSLLFGIAAVVPLEYSLATLLGVYVGGIYGGSITAILLNIPGTGSSVATLMDGHPLALRGKAMFAIRVTRAASVIGTAVGACMLLFLTPLLTRAALHFTSPEFFGMALLGILLCGGVSSGGDALKGWICGLLGLFLAFVGMDITEGSQRFVFGIPDLLSGISLVPVVIGLFAVPEVLNYYAHPFAEASKAQKIPSARLSDFGVLKEIRNKFRLIAQSALIGVGLGVLPGVGEDIAAWTAYGAAKKTSKHPEEFGKGSVEGVIAPEVANNSAIGGAFVPLLSLGIPGSPGAAIFLGALLLYGMRPGPMLILEKPNLLPQMFATLLLADVCLLISATLFIKPIIGILRISGKYLMPCILAVAGIAAYATDLSRFNFAVMLVAGGIGYLLRLMKYPPSPIILGLILGKMLDDKFRTTLVIGDGSFMPFIARPVSCVLLLLVSGIILWPIIARFRKNRKIRDGYAA
ncbi:MAG: tripartite tricarboxylate transporter permease [Deltaproteobacteria bacterium]|jgi:putative tricarboxylic transport membrane protein|nr:tripartite tricarboxylate transporter permease [Deltaproteobacteria bacterium]